MHGTLQPSSGNPAPAVVRPGHPTSHATVSHHAPTPSGGKTPGDYVRALIRRCWLVLTVGVLVAVPGSLLVLKQKDVYRAQAQILLEPPQIDEVLAGLFTHQSVGRKASESDARYVTNKLIYLRSKDLADRVVHDRSVDPPPPGTLDPGFELLKGLSPKPIPQSSRCDISLEGNDPRRVAQLLNRLLELFKEEVKSEHGGQFDNWKRQANARLQDMRKALNEEDRKLLQLVENTRIFASGNRNLNEERYTTLNSILAQKKMRFDDLQYEAKLSEIYPHFKKQSQTHSPEDERLAQLEKQRRYFADMGKNLQRLSRKPASDPTAVHLANQLRQVMDEINQLKARKRPSEPGADLHSVALETFSHDIEKLEAEVAHAYVELRDSTPAYQEYQILSRDREQKFQAINTMEAKLADFQILIESKNDPVRILQAAATPTAPVRPNRPMMIAGVIVLGLALGGGLVCLIESVDRKVRVPEQLTQGLGLPLFGVVPRMRRSARLQRGGHLWTPGLPTSVEADAYRNLRASLLGLLGRHGEPVATLLVTSAKAGEGKSTTALNLAATCARAGERTLLMDVDLRRPSLGDVFEDAQGRPGLVGVLKGEVAWQRTVVRTDLPNLDFLPTGDPRDVPIEILGSLELRQLVAAVAGQYDRIILDGPAVLGLADCRMLGRIVDAAVLVVRSGAHELRPLQRAKAMLEQSQVPVAGVVFNGLIEDFKDWSSYGSAHYGYGDDLGSAPALPSGRAGTRAVALAASP